MTSNGADYPDPMHMLLLTPQESRRLAELFELQDDRGLSDGEQVELRALVDTYGLLMHEQRMYRFARQRGIPVDQVRRETQEQLDEALEWWRAFEADPARRQEVEELARQRRAQEVETLTGQRQA